MTRHNLILNATLLRRTCVKRPYMELVQDFLECTSEELQHYIDHFREYEGGNATSFPVYDAQIIKMVS